MNKILSIIAALTMCISLTACGDTGSEKTAENDKTETTETSSMDQKEYLDIIANEIMIPKSCCAELKDKHTYTVLDKEYSTYTIDIKEKYTIQISFDKISKNSIGWTTEEMQEDCKNLFLLSVLDNFEPYVDDKNTPCDIESEPINNFYLFTLKYEDKTGFIACRDYNGFKYTINLVYTDIDLKKHKTITIEDCYEDFKDLISNIKVL